MQGSVKIILRLALAALMIAIFCAVAAGFWLRAWLHELKPVVSEQSVVEVQAGQSVAAIAATLHSQGLLQYPSLWRLYVQYFQPEPIKAGEYQLREFESPSSILSLLQNGQVISYSVTLVEGRTFADFVAVLAGEPKLTSELHAMTQAEQLRRLGLDLEHVEGWFYPDTYQYHAGDSDVDILLRAHQKMQLVLHQQWPQRQQDLPYSSPYEALIMASIIEKETGVGHERAQIAGVFVRRLRKGMRLQTDPTVIYGLGERYDGNIKRQDLREATPYNTYVIKGLPPTPIAMPGTAAIHAALHPAAGAELYFVARGDGTHHFSVSLNEHNNAVRRYQRRRVKDYRSAPP